MAGYAGKGAIKGFLVWLHLGSLRTASLEFPVEFSESPDSSLHTSWDSEAVDLGKAVLLIETSSSEG